jgi:hypothetical protein
MNLKGNFGWVPSVSHWNIWNNSDADCGMENDTPENENDTAENNAKRFRDYAAECRRLAQRASDKDRIVLIEIADAWISAAEEAERKSRSFKKE